MNSIHKIIAVIFVYCKFASLVSVAGDYGANHIDLPESHLPYYFNSFPKVLEQCLSNSNCTYRTLLTSDEYNNKKCWGYEPGCAPENSFPRPACAKEKPGWIKSHEEYEKTFYDQADFGKILFSKSYHAVR